MSVRPVENTTMVTGDGAVTYTINDTEGKDWVQKSGEGSNQAYTYVGLYVEMPEGAVSLKQNFEGDPENMDDVAADSLFLADRKYQSWYPVAEGRGGDNGNPPSRSSRAAGSIPCCWNGMTRRVTFWRTDASMSRSPASWEKALPRCRLAS